MPGPHLIYFADPMCSWCWGFAPVITAIEHTLGSALPIRLILGGLRPGNTTPLTAATKAPIREHWEHVQDATGQPFDFGFFDRDGFIYDTEPASRAAVILRRHSQSQGLAALRRLQHAFYAENRDITAPAELTAIAGEFGYDADAFAADMASDQARQETLADFAISQETGVSGFPTLIAGTGEDNTYAMVTQGYNEPGRLIPALAQWLKNLDKTPN
jgi:putative protein-disulfide isomerase